MMASYYRFGTDNTLLMKRIEGAFFQWDGRTWIKDHNLMRHLATGEADSITEDQACTKMLEKATRRGWSH